MNENSFQQKQDYRPTICYDCAMIANENFYIAVTMSKTFTVSNNTIRNAFAKIEIDIERRRCTYKVLKALTT